MRLFVVDDCDLTREFVRAQCLLLNRWSVAGESKTVEEAIGQIPSACPDVLLLDVNLPDDDGFSVVEYLKSSESRIKIIVFSVYLSEYTVSQCELFRVSGYVDKRATAGSGLLAALNAIAAGGVYFPDSYHVAKQRWLANPFAVSKRLSEREVQVMLLVAQGLTDVEIAAELGVTESTAATQRGKVMRRLNIQSTPKLMACAFERGFGPNR